MKPLWIVLTVSLLLFGAGMVVGEVITIEVPIPRTAVDLQLLSDADGKVVRYILWSDGSLTTTIGNRSYYAIPTPKDCPEDIDGDGVVAIPDLLLLNAAMGKKCPR